MESRGQYLVKLAAEISCPNEAIIIEDINNHGSDVSAGSQENQDIEIMELHNNYASPNEAIIIEDINNHGSDVSAGSQENQDIEIMELHNNYANLNDAIIIEVINNHESDVGAGSQENQDIEIMELHNNYASPNDAIIVEDINNHGSDVGAGSQENQDIEIMELHNNYASPNDAIIVEDINNHGSDVVAGSEENQDIEIMELHNNYAREDYGHCRDDDDDDDVDDPDYIPNSQEDVNFVSHIPRKAGRCQTVHSSENVAATSGDMESGEAGRCQTVHSSENVAATSGDISVSESLENSSLCNESGTKTSRKRMRAENTWRRNEIKRKHNRGEAYMNWRGVHVEQRSIKEVCNNCRMKCPTKFNEDERLTIFSEFWNLGDIDRQRDFIINTIQQAPKKRIRMRNGGENGDSRRNMTFSYSLKCNGKQEVVCQRFFLNTLSISQQMVKTAFLKMQASGKTVSEDRRGKSGCNSKLDDEVKNSVKHHIESFPTVESHYCRRDSKRKYLDQNLNLSKMYSLYKVHCQENKITSMAKKSMYRYIFNTNYNLGFFQPKKDQCDLCEKFKNMDEEGKISFQEVIDEHLGNKVAAREAKEKAKERSKNDSTYFSAVFDMQQVLQTPHLEVSQLFYRRKLSTYNLSVYDLHEKKGFCFMWDETKGQRGSNEIASCVKQIIEKKVEEGKKEMCFFSDNCGGQNLNRNVVVMYLHSAMNNNIKITHCFLEKGHTQNEGDSVHSSIERASKNVAVYAPDQWYLLARSACRRSPYNVIEMYEFLDFVGLRNETCNKMDKDEYGEKVRWQKVRVIMVDPKEINCVFIKYNYGDEFTRINIESRTRKRLSSLLHKDVKKAYTSELAISTKKFLDLKYLCDNLVIPKSYHNYYRNINHCSKVQSSLDD